MSKQKTNYVQNAYWERNMLALLLANQAEGSGWYYDEKAKGKKCDRVISINYGQLTFHIPKDFDVGNLPEIADDWDGHSKEEKWLRIRNMCR
jgi:hypothetical protein